MIVLPRWQPIQSRLDVGQLVELAVLVGRDQRRHFDDPADFRQLLVFRASGHAHFLRRVRRTLRSACPKLAPAVRSKSGPFCSTGRSRARRPACAATVMI